MFNQSATSFVSWFHSTAHWWFRTLFGRLALLFALAATVLVILSYYIFNWAVEDKDTILDIHDLYYHYKFVDSWDDLSDTASIREELNNLQLGGIIYYLTSDTLCVDDYIYNKQKEVQLTYWSNVKENISICNYLGYQNSNSIEIDYEITFPGYVSFGDIYINHDIHPATVIETNQYRILLYIPSFIYQSEWYTFFPIVSLSVLFMLLLYLFVRRFLKPIYLMENRILSLQKGDLDSEIPIIGADELALLSLNFNRLIKEIKNLLGQKERLLSDVSHEIRTPLAKMKLLTAMSKTNDDKIKKIDKQISALDSIVTNILISDKLSAPYSNLDIEKISLKNLLQQALDLAKQQNVDIQIKTTDFISCDVVKMAIAIKNILDNAEKYAPSDKPVTIEASITKKEATITIIDDGPGIPKKLLKTITDPYTRGSNLKKSGFGLGLSICQKVIKAHNGSLMISNHKTRGAIFKLVWPTRGEKNAKK